MIDFSLQIPTKIDFGRDSLSHLEEEVRRYGTRVLLVPMLYYDTPYTYTFTVTGAVNVTFEANDGGGGGIFTITMEG